VAYSDESFWITRKKKFWEGNRRGEDRIRGLRLSCSESRPSGQAHKKGGKTLKKNPQEKEGGDEGKQRGDGEICQIGGEKHGGNCGTEKKLARLVKSRAKKIKNRKNTGSHRSVRNAPGFKKPGEKKTKGGTKGKHNGEGRGACAGSGLKWIGVPKKERPG